MIPLYGFLEGDTIGLLMLADENETIQSLLEKLKRSARIRVADSGASHLQYKGRTIDPMLKVSRVGFEPLGRFDVVFNKSQGRILDGI